MVLLCEDGSIGSLNLQRTINSGGGSLITPSVMAPLVLTGMQCGLLSCSEGADPIGTWAVDSTYWAGGPWGAGPSVWGTCSEGAGVHSVHVVHGFS